MAAWRPVPALSFTLTATFASVVGSGGALLAWESVNPWPKALAIELGAKGPFRA